MARLVLHIGTHKTATTTIQNTLAANARFLARRGVLYPEIPPGNAHHALATRWIDLPKRYCSPIPVVDLWKEVARLAHGDATVILSSEEFSRGRLKSVDFADLRDIVGAFSERLVVCMLRNQVAYLQSIYLQVAGDWPQLAFEAFLGKALRERYATGVFLDYGALYDHLLAGFPSEEIRFLSYEAACRHEGGVVGAFLAGVGISSTGLVPLAAGDSNVSPEPLVSWAANQVTAPEAPGPLIALAQATFTETFGTGARSTLYNPAEAARVAARFAPLNAAFEARYRKIDPGFAMAPLTLPSNLVYRSQLTTPFWGRLSKRPHDEAGRRTLEATRMSRPDPILRSGDPAFERRVEAAFARVGIPGGLPKWPAKEVQRQYNGMDGLPLMRRTLRFVEALEQVGALTPGWRGLDYGCGWGRIASLMLTKGGPEQLDLCDAWPSTIEVLKKANFRNRTFLISEVLEAGQINRGAYDFIYAFSIFTHLRRDAFENNLGMLLGGLKLSGKLYVTVRHEDYMTQAKAKPEDLAALRRDGFWYRPTGNSVFFGIAVITRAYLEALPRPGSLDYLGEVDPCQHLYAFGAA